MNPFLLTLLQAIVVLGIAPLAMGLVRVVKARLQGRHGASVFLPYWTLLTMLKKEMVISPTSSWLFRVAPFLVLGSTVFLALVIPLVGVGGGLMGLSDLFVVAGVLMLGAAFLVMSGLDSGSAFGGMGSSREMTIASLLEPAMLLTFATLATTVRSFRLDDIFSSTDLRILTHPALLFALIAMILIALAENARYPVDNPATHLELTMVHEAMILDYSGPYLAMMEYASALKLTIFALVIGNLLFPTTLFAATSNATAVILAIIFAIVKIMVAMGLLGLLETSIVKMRFFRMQEYLSLACMAAGVGLIAAILTSSV